jgi:hypothetical protein
LSKSVKFCSGIVTHFLPDFTAFSIYPTHYQRTENIWFKGAYGSEFHYAILKREWEQK